MASQAGDAEDRLGIEETQFVGRTPSEYEMIFDVELDSFQYDSVLDCPGGPCGFTAAANEAGIDATAADLMYGVEPDSLSERCSSDIQKVRKSFEKGDVSRFNWEYYGNTDGLIEQLEAAYEIFIQDYRDNYGTQRYVEAELPDLPFEDNSFELVLSAHLLFLYRKKFSYDFHRESLLELARVASEEVRVYPLTIIAESEDYPRIDELRDELHSRGHDTRREDSDFAFLSNSPEMLVISPSSV